MKKVNLGLCLVCLGVLAGCGGSSSNNGSGAGPVLLSIAIAPGNASVGAGGTLQFAATGSYSNGSSKDLTSSAAWSSSNTSVASISSSGLATTKAAGSPTITATFGTVSGSTILNVTAAKLTSIAVTPASSSIAQGTTQQFMAIGTLSDGSTQNLTATVTWTSSAAVVAISNAVAKQGLAQGLAPGTSTITATSGTIFGSATLTVTNAFVTSIAVTPANASIPLGTLQQFTATGTYSDLTTQDISDVVTWTSSAPSVASVTVSGVVTARNLGSVTITASMSAANGNTSLNINAANLASIAILPGNVTIAQATSEQFQAVGTFDDGGTRPLTSQVTWSSSNTAVATLGSTPGLAKGLSPGITTITATLGSLTNSVTLDVSNANIASISVVPSSQTIAPATKLSFTATGLFSDSSTQNITRDVTWASSNSSVATIGSGAKGTATAVGAGTTTISATWNGTTGSTPLNVSSATLVSIALSPASAVLAPASTLAYSATGTFSDGTTQGISTAVTWSSSASNVASINSNGVVTGQSAGTASITAQLGTVTGSAQVVVEASPLVSLQIQPASVSIAAETTTQFTAIGTFGDGSTQKLTSSVTWTSLPTSVATISNIPGTNGLAMGAAPGPSTITAVFAGQVGTASLTVTKAVLTSISVSPGSSSIALGGSQHFTATGNFSDGTTQNLTSQATWSSSNTSVASIGASGVANSAGAGTTTIAATLNGVSGTAVLTVH